MAAFSDSISTGRVDGSEDAGAVAALDAIALVVGESDPRHEVRHTTSEPTNRALKALRRQRGDLVT